MSKKTDDKHAIVTNASKTLEKLRQKGYNVSMEMLYKNSYVDSLDAVVEKVLARKVDLGVKHIVIVPDVYTFTLEKRLFSVGAGAFDVEVTTFNRLYLRHAQSNAKALSKQGAIMLLKKICADNEKKLVCYGRSSQRTGFAVKLYDAISKLRACAITPEELSKVKGMYKASDLALLYGEYERLTSGKYVDASGRTELLREEVKRGLLKNCHVYVALYDTLSRQAERLLDAIDENCLSLTVSNTKIFSGYEVSAPVRTLSCPDAVTQYKECAREIKKYVYGGGRFGDWAVVADGANIPALKRIFDEYGVAYHVDEKIALSSCELARFILGCISAVQKKYRTADMLSLASNYYLGISKAESDAFKNFVKKYCVDYLGFTKSFALKGEEGEKIEPIRQKIMNILSVLPEDFSDAKNFSDAVLRLLESVDAKSKTETLAHEDGRTLSQIYDKTVEIVSLLGELMGGKYEDEDTVVDALTEGLTGTEISLVPSRRDTVQIGPLSLFRGQRVKCAVIVDFCEGKVPVVTKDDGLLLDMDAEKLDEYKLKVEPKNNKKNELCRDELWQFLKTAQNLFLYCVNGDESKPACDLKILLKKNNLKEENYAQVLARRKEESDLNALVYELGSKQGVIEFALGDREGKLFESLLSLVERNDLFEEKNYGEKKLSVKSLFFASGATSVSALQTYFTCPYKYFLQYGLYVRKKDDGEVTPIDVGLLLHKIIENYVKENMPEDVHSFVQKSVPLALEEFEKYSYSDESEKILNRLMKEAEKLCNVAREQIRAGDFVPIGTEVSFGKENSTLKTVSYPSGVSLMGEIDRIDAYKDFARVIDYKTGSVEFSYSDLYYGKKIQLMIYMRILINNGYRPAGFFYFPFAVAWRDDEYSHRLTGAFNTDFEVITAFDRSVAQGGKSKVFEGEVKIGKEGKISFGRNAKAKSEEELFALTQYAEKVAGKAIDDINEGRISARPSVSGMNSSCAYCEYKSVCPRVFEREIGTVSADEVIEAARK